MKPAGTREDREGSSAQPAVKPDVNREDREGSSVQQAVKPAVTRAGVMTCTLCGCEQFCCGGAAVQATVHECGSRCS